MALRNSKFIRENRWKQDSISHRLATRAMKEIETTRSKKGLTRKFKKTCILDYNTECRVRNCLICAEIPNTEVNQ